MNMVHVFPNAFLLKWVCVIPTAGGLYSFILIISQQVPNPDMHYCFSDDVATDGVIHAVVERTPCPSDSLLLPFEKLSLGWGLCCCFELTLFWVFVWQAAWRNKKPFTLSDAICISGTVALVKALVLCVFRFVPWLCSWSWLKSTGPLSSCQVVLEIISRLSHWQ